jgi:hypothetical protein
MGRFLRKFVFYFALSLMVMAASFSPQIPPEHNPVKTTQQAKKGKKKQDASL